MTFATRSLAPAAPGGLLARSPGTGGTCRLAAGLRAATRRQHLAGWLVVLLFFGGGGTWAWLAPLASAAVAPGVVGPEGKRKTIQHLEGGIVRAIHVREGGAVRAGDPLVTLEDIRARAEHGVLKGQYLALLATVARLEAEQGDAERPVFPAALEVEAADPEVARIVATQRELFAAHHAVRAGRRWITNQRIAQLEAENASLEKQIAAQGTQLELIATEIESVQALLAKGLERRPRLLALQRSKAGIEGEQAGLRGRIAANLETIGQARLENLTAEQEDRRQVNADLDDARKRLDEIRNRLPSSEDALARTVVRAPVDGRVVDLKTTTVGGVLKPGEPILDLVPSQAELLIAAKLDPRDIKDVRRGLPARVVLTAYPQRNLPIVHGTVREVSADRLTDQRTGKPYFEAQVQVDRAELAALDGEVALLSGMPAEVMILTGERTLLDYLLRPFYDVLRRAFRER
ncbi:HlyD family type I secretion periplasmic adaptor subunit [Benzoatithermus flavus]|uniref:Membrane fusion protein (MFP) family protein n=1 Tax=Benzoatithermus flavus TaxID=3108223 RepID=A0ABU8XSZ7_9PROT